MAATLVSGLGTGRAGSGRASALFGVIAYSVNQRHAARLECGWLWARSGWMCCACSSGRGVKLAGLGILFGVVGTLARGADPVELVGGCLGQRSPDVRVRHRAAGGGGIGGQLAPRPARRPDQPDGRA